MVQVTTPRLTSLPYKGHFAHPTASQRLELTSTIPSDFLECCWQNIGFPPTGPKNGRLRQGSSAHHRGKVSVVPSCCCSSSWEAPAMFFLPSSPSPLFFSFRRKLGNGKILEGLNTSDAKCVAAALEAFWFKPVSLAYLSAAPLPPFGAVASGRPAQKKVEVVKRFRQRKDGTRLFWHSKL